MRYINAGTDVPHLGVAYHSGALYEIALVLVVLAATLLIRARLRRPGQLFWLVLAGYSTSRFFAFIGVRDVPVIALSLRNAQWTSLALLLVSIAGLLASYRRSQAPGRQLRSSW